MNTEYALRVLANAGQITVWYVQGDEAEHLFVTEADAERYRADRYGDESPNWQIYCKNVETYFG